jgi:SAM-dependent methyltransferase
VERIARPKAVFVASIVGGRGTWVDIGCGTGELLSAAQSLGWQCRGVESDPDEIEFGRRHGFEIASGFVDVSNAAALVAGAQLVSLVNILEHVLDPVGLLGAISSGIAAGGYVVCEVPRHPSLSALASQAFPELACRHIYAPDHLHVFTEASAERMLESAGLEAISVWTFGQDFWDLTNAVLTARLPGADARWRVVTDNAPSIQAAVDRAGLSDTLFMVARKR